MDPGIVLAGEGDRALLTDAVGDSAFNARAPEPAHKAAAVVIAAQRALGERRAAVAGIKPPGGRWIRFPPGNSRS